MSGKQHALTLRLDEPLWQRLRREAFERDMAVSDVIREAVDQHVAAAAEEAL